MASFAKSDGARDVRLWVGAPVEDSDSQEVFGKFEAVKVLPPNRQGRGIPPPNSVLHASLSARPVCESAAYTSNTSSNGFTTFVGATETREDSDSSSEDEDDGKSAFEHCKSAASSVLVFVATRFDLLLGIAGACAALWLWLSLDSSTRNDGRNHAWRWALFGACVFLGRFLARSLVAAAIFALDRYDFIVTARDSKDSESGTPNNHPNSSETSHRRPVNAVLYYVNVMRGDIKHTLLVVGVAVAWTTLMRPARDVVGAEAYANVSRALGCVIVVVVFRGLRNYLTHWLASRLHSSTLWEQLHATTRQESILKRLAGPPIRPRPRSRAKAKARWTLVKRKLTDEMGSPGGEKGNSGGGKHLRKKSDNDKGGLGMKDSAKPPVVATKQSQVPARKTSSSQPVPNFFLFPSPRTPDPLLSGSTGQSVDSKTTGQLNETPSHHPPENASNWLPSVIESLEEASAMDGAATVRGGDGETPRSPADALLEKTEQEHAALADAPHAAPISASAAAAVVGATEEPVVSSSVSLRVIDAAARHVLRGTFALPFRVLTASKPRKTSGNTTALQKTIHSKSQHGDLKATTKRAFVSSPEDADAAATMMFTHLRRPGQPFVTPDAVGDFVEQDKVEEAFQLIGGSDSGVAALAESNIQVAMRKIYEQREACSKTLANTAGLVRNVGRLLTALLGIVALFTSLGIFRVDVANLWLVFSSALLAFAFVFGQTAATMFRALIMIFVTNPFGVGDWVRFGNDPVAVKVHELGLNFVVVATFWGELIFLPVSTCLDAQIYNLSRSPPLWMNAAFDLDVGSISASDVERLQTSLASHCDSDSANYAKGSVEVICREVRDPLKIRVSCFYQLAFNASEFSRKLAANSRFLLALQASMMEIGLSYCGTDGQIFTCEETGETKSLRALKAEQRGRTESGRGTPVAPSPAQSRRVSKGDVARDIAREFKAGQAKQREQREGTPEQRAVSSAVGVPADPQSVTSGPALDFERQTEGRAGKEHRDAAGHPQAGYVPGIGYVIPDILSGGLRYRGSHRIPGRVRHYTGNLRDMSEVVRFDAREGQFDE